MGVSVAKQNFKMSQTDIECGFNENHRQRIPLNRMYSEAPSCTESVRRQKMRLIFDEVIQIIR